MQHVDIVFDGPPGPEAGRFIEVEDAAGNSIKLGEWIETDKGGPVAGSAVAYVKPTWVLRIEDPRELRRQVDGVWDVLDHRVDGQPFWTEREVDLGMAVAQVLRHYRDQVTLIVSQRDRYLAELEKAQLRIKQVENEKADLDRSAQSAARIATEQVTKLCEEKEAAWRQADDARKTAADALTARDQVWRELQAMREATMLEPANGDWANITPDHVRQHVQDMGDRIESQAAEIRALRLRIERRDGEYDARLEEIENLKRAKSGSWNELTARAEKAEREREQLAAECAAWSKVAVRLDPQAITPPQLDHQVDRVSDELAKARVARDEWHAVARRLASKVQTPAEFSELLDTLQEGMRTGSRACVELEALRKEHDRDRTLLDTLGRVLLGQNARRPYAGHDIERAALETKRTADALPEAAKVLGIVNLTPHDLVEHVTRLRETVDTRSKQLDDTNELVARFRKTLVIRNSPKLDPAAELEEIRAIVLASLKRAEVTPIEPLLSLVGELAGAHDAAATERDEMAQEMARGVHPEDVAQAISAVADVDADEETDDDEITIGLDDACDILGDVLIEHVDDDAIEGIVEEFRSRWDDDETEADDEPAEPAEVKISDEQIDTIVDRLAERLASTGSRVRVIKPRGR